MSSKSTEKKTLHLRNRNRHSYDMPALTIAIPELKNHIKPSKSGSASINFADPKAVKLLNKALLKHYYGITYWEFPNTNLCPPIPGRADYIHYMADLLGESNFNTVPIGAQITFLDIGLGASCIYPILGSIEYGWQCIGSDIDPKTIACAEAIVNANALIQDKISCRLQKNTAHIFQGIIGEEDKIDFTICNPPFHSSVADALKGTQRKIKNLSGKKAKIPERNFAGISHELVCEGGEYGFIHTMIRESEKFSKNCYWFSSLVSKQSNLKRIYAALTKSNAHLIKTIPMGTANKTSRIVAWTFLSSEERKEWRNTRWRMTS